MHTMTELSEEAAGEKIQTIQAEAVAEESKQVESTNHSPDLEEKPAEFKTTKPLDGQWEEVYVCRHQTTSMFISDLTCFTYHRKTTCILPRIDPH